MLSGADLCTRVTAGDDAHTLDAFRHTHVGIENAAVGGEVHATDIVSGERSVLQLNPCLPLSVLVFDVGGVVGQHLIDADVIGPLAKHPCGA